AGGIDLGGGALADARVGHAGVIQLAGRWELVITARPGQQSTDHEKLDAPAHGPLLDSHPIAGCALNPAAGSRPGAAVVAAPLHRASAPAETPSSARPVPGGCVRPARGS